jgi:hypothetical protein
MSPLYRVFLSFCSVVTFAITTEPYVLLEQGSGIIGLDPLASDQLSPPSIDSSGGAVTPSEQEIPWLDVQNMYPCMFHYPYNLCHI